ncbi:MAG: hypothetical protein KGH94_05450 [Candidatus Micrarchaeota archaeon]|nr:hypothetical protein [Candidatus Micrarchaeota archaeon]
MSEVCIDKVKAIKALDKAAIVQPCITCREDIKDLRRSIEKDTDIPSSVKRSALLCDVGVKVAKIVGSVYLLPIPKAYNDLQSVRKSNLDCYLNLKAASWTIVNPSELYEILDSFCNVSYFKSKCSPKQLYIFDKLSRIGEKWLMPKRTAI